MLKQRIITALVLIPPLLAAFFFLSPLFVALLLGMFVAVGAWEWATLCGMSAVRRFVYVVVLVLLGALLFVGAVRDAAIAFAIFGAAALWWLLMPFELARPTGGVLRSAGLRVIAGVLILLPAWLALSLLHTVDVQRPSLLLYVIVLVAFADTAAYAAGHAFGRRKLAPAISPGKTLEGVAGGVVAVVLLAYFCGRGIWSLEGARLALWVALSVVTGLISVVGDLVESKMKRIAGVKDSGKVLPGHGGVLDRIDALTAAAPIFALGSLALLRMPS